MSNYQIQIKRTLFDVMLSPEEVLLMTEVHQTLSWQAIVFEVGTEFYDRFTLNVSRSPQRLLRNPNVWSHSQKSVIQ